MRPRLDAPSSLLSRSPTSKNTQNAMSPTLNVKGAESGYARVVGSGLSGACAFAQGTAPTRD